MIVDRNLFKPRRLFAAIVAIILISGAGSVDGKSRDDSARELAKYNGQLLTGIEFEGLNHTRNYIVTREIQSEIGKPLDSKLVRDDLTRLRDLPIFFSVGVKPIPNDEGVALIFEMSELPRIVPHPAISYTEENGFSYGAGVKSPNLSGRATFLSAKFLLGGDQTYNFLLFNPWIAGDHLSGGIDLGHNRREDKLLDFEETSDIFQLNAGTWLGNSGRLTARAGYTSVGSNLDSITLDPDNQDRMYFGSVALGFDNRDSVNSPRLGWHNEWINLTYFGGDPNFWVFQSDINRYHPIGKSQSIVFGTLASFQTGIVDVDIPQYFQYFMGGSNSIRGYKLEELGKEIYGKNQLLVNLEHRWNFFPMQDFPILKWKVSAGLQLAGFADAGIAWSNSRDFNLDRTRCGFGAGLRLLIPVLELVRLDVGVSQYGDFVFNFGVRSIFYGRRLRVR